MDNKEEQEFLKNYNSNIYPKPSVTTDAVVFTIGEVSQGLRNRPLKVLQILLVRRKGHPFKDFWALPGGFLNMDENLDTCVKRELEEEAGIKDIYLEQLYTWGDVDRDPRTRVISTSYMALLPKEKIGPVTAGDDAREAKWFNVSRIKMQSNTGLKSGLAFKSATDSEVFYAAIDLSDRVAERGGLAFDHAKIIDCALDRLGNKITYTDIAFSMMPGQFTLTELQMVYEAILGRELLTANFRTQIKDKVMETDEYEQDKPWRPAKLFKFNSDWKAERF